MPCHAINAVYILYGVARGLAVTSYSVRLAIRLGLGLGLGVGKSLLSVGTTRDQLPARPLDMSLANIFVCY